MSLTATISSKGQVVIPAELRRKYGLKEGVRIVFHDDGGHLTLEPSRFADIYALQGSLHGYGLEQALHDEREAERLREDMR
jgi:AbrB family looped-hinge helix DNA binding protein